MDQDGPRHWTRWCAVVICKDAICDVFAFVAVDGKRQMLTRGMQEYEEMGFFF